jgi:hypothetical protein
MKANAKLEAINIFGAEAKLDDEDSGRACVSWCTTKASKDTSR